MTTKKWTIPTVLRELRRVYDEGMGADIMTTATAGLTVDEMIDQLTTYHMELQMLPPQIPGQSSIVIDEDEGM